MEKNNESSLIRTLGVWGLAAAIFNTTVGGGIFRLPAAVHEMIGAAGPIVYVVCAIAMGLIVLCFAEAGSRVSLTGGPYAYVETVFGPYVGFLAAVLVWLVGIFSLAGVSTALAGQAASLVPALGSASGRIALMVSVFAVLTWINIRGVRQGARVISIASVAKLIPLLILIGVGAFFVEPSNLAIETVPPAGDIARTAMVLIFAFAGIESALVPSGEVKDPARTVPRAIALAMIGVTVLYLLIQIVAQGVLGADLVQSKDAPLAAVAGHIMGPGGRLLLIVGALISMFGYVSGMILATPRTLFALGRDGIIPKAFASIHPKYQTPWIAIAVNSTVVCAFAITSTFEQLAILANLAAILLYLGCAIASWQLRKKNISIPGTRPLDLPGGPIIPILTCAVIFWLLTSITSQEWMAAGATLVIASILFLFSRIRRRQQQEAVAPANV